MTDTFKSIVVAALLLVAIPVSADVLSERVRELIDEKGVEDARKEMPQLMVAAMGDLQVDEKGMLALADRYLAEENLDAAEIVVQLQMLIGSSAEVSAKLGDVYMAKGSLLGAAPFYQQTLSENPGHEHAKHQLARIAEKHPEIHGPTRVEKQQESTVADKNDPGGLLPKVLVSDPDEAGSLDWAALRKRAGTDYPSRWDDLTVVDSCLWITPDELAEHLGLSLKVTAKRIDFQCKYRVHLPNGDSGILLSVYVELHDGTEYVRKAEANHSQGVSGMQFTPFDAGTPDLNVYVHKKGTYLYAFPRDGRTLWRLGYRPSYGMDEIHPPDVGPRYMKLLVRKYADRL